MQRIFSSPECYSVNYEGVLVIKMSRIARPNFFVPGRNHAIRVGYKVPKLADKFPLCFNKETFACFGCSFSGPESTELSLRLSYFQENYN